MDKRIDLSTPSGSTIACAAYLCESPKANLVIHTGMCEHATRYEHFARFLNSKGYNVYVHDALGQGMNAASAEEQQRWPKDGFFISVDCLADHISSLKAESGLPTYLFGHSMGSFMTQSFLERHPGLADKVVLCGSNGPARMLMKLGSILASMITTKKNWDKPSKFLYGLTLGGYAKAVPEHNGLGWLSYNEENVVAYAADPYCGADNTHGFYKGFLKGMDSLYAPKNLKKISADEHLLLVAGEGDPVGEMGKGVKRLEAMYAKLGVKDLSCIIYPNMRHEILNEKDNMKVYEDILAFLEK